MLGAAGRGLWVLAAGALLVLAWPLRPRWRADDLVERALAHRAPLVLSALGGALFALASFWWFRRFGYRLPAGTLVLALAVAALARPDRLWPPVLLSLGALACAIFESPLAVERSDMLPAIAYTLDVWWRGGDPYALGQFPSGALVRMPYLPGTFFAHLPAFLLGIDLRWSQVLYRALWIALLWPALRARPAGDPWRGLFQWLLLSPYLVFRHELYFDVFLLLIVAFERAHTVARGLALPALIVTRQWAWVMAPFAVLHDLRTHGRRAFAAYAAGTVAVGVLTFALLSRHTTLEQFRATVFWFDAVLGWPVFGGDYGPTLAPLLFGLHLSKAIPALQALVCLGALALGWRHRAEAVFGLWALFAFVALNGHYWNYFWLSPVVWSLAVALTPQDE